MQKIYAYLLIIWLVYACKRDDDVYRIGGDGVTVNDILRFSEISSNNAEADSVSSIVIKVSVSNSSEWPSSEIIFKASKGFFNNGDTIFTANTNMSKIAFAELKSQDIGKVEVSAQVGAFRIDTNMTFVAALPDDFILTTDQYVVTVEEEVTINAQMFRDPGRGNVTDPVKVYYQISNDSTRETSLVVPDFSYSTHGFSSVVIKNPNQTTGRFHIMAYMNSATQDTLKKQLTFTIQ